MNREEGVGPRWGPWVNKAEKCKSVAFRVYILTYFDLTLRLQFYLSDLGLSQNMTGIYRRVL